MPHNPPREADGEPDDWFRSPDWGIAAQEIFERKLQHPFLNHLRFEYLAAEARLAAGLGIVDKAAACAGAALGMKSVGSPKFVRHPDVGLIAASQVTVQEMERLAGVDGQTARLAIDDASRVRVLSLLPDWLQSLLY